MAKCWYSTQGDFICNESAVYNLKPIYGKPINEHFATPLRPAYLNDKSKRSACSERLSYGDILPATEGELKGVVQYSHSGLLYENRY